jgi:hypothetical protein
VTVLDPIAREVERGEIGRAHKEDDGAVGAEVGLCHIKSASQTSHRKEAQDLSHFAYGNGARKLGNIMKEVY